MLWPATLALAIACAVYFLFHKSAYPQFVGSITVGIRKKTRNADAWGSKSLLVVFAAVCTAIASKAAFSNYYFSNLIAYGAVWEVVLLVLVEEAFFRAIAQRFLGLAGQALVYAFMMSFAFSSDFQSFLLNFGFLLGLGMASGLVFHNFGFWYSAGYRLSAIAAFVIGTFSGTFLLSSFMLLLPFALLIFGGHGLGRSAELLGIRRMDLRQFVASTIVLFIVAIVGLNAIGALLGGFGVADVTKVASLVRTQNAFSLVLAVSLGPLGEEVLFRGYLAKKTGVVFSSMLFGLSHFFYGSLVEVAAAVFVGLLLAYYCKRADNILPAIAMHALYNAATLFVIFGAKL